MNFWRLHIRPRGGDCGTEGPKNVKFISRRSLLDFVKESRDILPEKIMRWYDISCE